MAPMPETNRVLWEALDAIYERQQAAITEAMEDLRKLAADQPSLARDPLARDAWQAAMDRQVGLARFADSQRALAETMLGYWDQRSVPTLPRPAAERPPLPASASQVVSQAAMALNPGE